MGTNNEKSNESGGWTESLTNSLAWKRPGQLPPPPVEVQIKVMGFFFFVIFLEACTLRIIIIMCQVCGDIGDHGLPILSVVSSPDELIARRFFFSFGSYSDWLCILCVDFLCFLVPQIFLLNSFAFLVHQLCLYAQKL